MRNKHFITLFGALLFVLACNLFSPTAPPETPAAVIPITGSTPTNAPAAPTAAAPTLKAIVSPGSTCFELRTPENNATLPETGRIDFTWQAMPDAVRYLLEITMPNGSIASFKTQDTKIHRYAESTAMGGTYQWQVTAYNSSDGVLCTAGPSSYSKPELSKRTKPRPEATEVQQCPPPPGCTVWDPVACVCNG